MSAPVKPTQAGCNYNLDLYNISSATWRILTAPDDLTTLTDEALAGLDYACLRMWREIDCDDLHNQVCEEREWRGLNKAFKGCGV